jgi:hypothetical protein
MNDQAEPSPPAAVAAATPLKRRGLLIGAGAVGAAVVAARVLPGAAPQVVAEAATAAKVIDASGGYQVTPHVLRYYETTRA